MTAVAPSHDLPDLDLDPGAAVLIGGIWSPGDRGTFSVLDPADDTVLANVADGGAAQAIAAVNAAASAANSWSATAPRARAEVLHRVLELMRRDAAQLTRLIVAENGKSTADAAAEVGYAAEFFRWYGEEAVRAAGSSFAVAPTGGVRNIVTQRPVGVAALVTPWNFPAAMAARKIAPALAAGCTVVLKPAAETPLTALALARLLHEAGVPDGVANIVPTTDPGEVVGAWLADERVRALSFTGSTRVGQLLLRQSAQRVLKTSMELGGNAPFVVLADANLDAAVDGAMIAKFRGGGQACTAANRFYVHADVRAEFVALLAERVNQLRVGKGADATTNIGPLISHAAVDAATAKVEDALQRGATVASQAELPDLPGSFFAPLVLTDVAPDARMVQEEVFAPVAPVVAWTDETELLEQVNGTEMGLASYVYSRDLGRALRLAERFEVGMVGVNRGLVSDVSAPFGGLKQSGLGREGARDGLLEYQETQYLSVAWS